jgi:hypothetical protein
MRSKRQHAARVDHDCSADTYDVPGIHRVLHPADGDKDTTPKRLSRRWCSIDRVWVLTSVVGSSGTRCHVRWCPDGLKSCLLILNQAANLL